MKLNASWNIWLASTWVPNWPFVVTLTMSKTFITRDDERRDDDTDGRGDLRQRDPPEHLRLVVAPSILAASMSSVGTALMAADRMTIENPVWIQIRMTISQKLLYGVSWTKKIGLGRRSRRSGGSEAADAATDDPGVSEEEPSDQHDQRCRAPRPGRAVPDERSGPGP